MQWGLETRFTVDGSIRSAGLRIFVEVLFRRERSQVPEANSFSLRDRLVTEAPRDPAPRIQAGPRCDLGQLYEQERRSSLSSSIARACTKATREIGAQERDVPVLGMLDHTSTSWTVAEA